MNSYTKAGRRGAVGIATQNLISAAKEGGFTREELHAVRLLRRGGKGPDAWDQEITLNGEDMTIKQAIEEI